MDSTTTEVIKIMIRLRYDYDPTIRNCDIGFTSMKRSPAVSAVSQMTLALQRFRRCPAPTYVFEPFAPVTAGDVAALIRSVPDKQCELDSLSLYHNCDSTVIRLDTTTTKN